MLILIDFDQTLTKQPTLSRVVLQEGAHSICYNYSNFEGMVENLNKPIQAARVLRACKQNNHTIYIVSNNANRDLINRYLTCLLGIDYLDVITRVISGNNQLVMKNGIANELAIKHQIEFRNTILVDDNPRQIGLRINHYLVSLADYLSNVSKL